MRSLNKIFEGVFAGKNTKALTIWETQPFNGVAHDHTKKRLSNPTGAKRIRKFYTDTLGRPDGKKATYKIAFAWYAKLEEKPFISNFKKEH